MDNFLEDELFFKDTGMDQDSEARFIEGYFKLLNGRNANGKINNIPSSLLITNPYLPAVGFNQCVGAFEDQRDNSCIFFNYNSQGFHGIYRYYSNVPGFTNGEIQLIRQVQYPLDYTFDNPNPLNFSNDPANVIAGIALVDNKLYWNQPNDKPKMIDATRSNVTRKRLRFSLLFNKEHFGGTVTYTLNVYKSGNPIPIHTFIWVAAGVQTYAGEVTAFVDAYNASPFTMAQFHIINHIDWVEIEMSKEGMFYLDLSASGGGGQPLIVASNFYPEKDTTLPVSYPTFKIDLISRVRYPSLIEPSCSYKTDTTRQSNLVKGKVFQFRTRYNYFDYSLSCLGAISNIAPNIMLNVDTSQIVNNYIEVDFTDQRLSDVSLVSIVRTVDILFREHNTGPWRIAATLDPYEFAGVGQQIFKFFNDGNYATIDDATAVKPYDSVPRTAKSLEMVGDRLFDGGILEGYDKIPIDAKIDVEYKSQQNPDLYTIQGCVFLYNVNKLVYNTGSPNVNDATYQYNQVIHSPTNDENNLCFGGISYSPIVVGPSPNDYTHDPINPNGVGPDKAPQRIPLGGFTMYLAGTDFFGTSVQYNTFPGTVGVPGWLKSQSDADRAQIRLWQNNHTVPPSNTWDCFNPFGLGLNAVDQNGNLIGRETSLDTCRVFSKFKIEGVPAGRYVMRVASHLITAAELNNGNRDYQKTSSHVLECGGASDDFEVIINVGPSTADVNNNVYIGRTVIADLLKPECGSGYFSSIVTGYLSDHDNAALNASSTFKQLMTDTRIEGARAAMILNNVFQLADNPWYVPFINTYGKIVGRWYFDHANLFCDHNGFFFYTIRSDNYNVDSVTFVSGGLFTASTTVIKDYYETVGFTATVNDQDGGLVTLWRNTLAASLTDYRTVLRGKVFSNGIPQPNIAVINTHGNFSITDANGDFAIICYARIVFVLTDPNGTRIDNVVFSSTNLTYQFSFAVPQQAYNILIGPGNYDFLNPYIFSDTDAVALIVIEVISAMKRGWDGQFGIVYYNEADQKCAVCTIDALILHILFYTEKDPITGLQVNPGYPILTWTINHRPPDWATKYQWVRQLNQQMLTQLQWIANKVEYINDNDDGTVYATPTDPSATMCKINLDNIGYYTINKHPNSVINFTFQKGDRLRPIRDAKNNLFPEYYEFEIIKVIGTDIYIYKDVTITFEKGTLFEVFSPRGDEEIKVFYEIGECYEVKTEEIEGVRQKFHAGPLQDQTYGPVPTQTVTPAKGVFKTGDAYYRTREMQIGCVLATDIAPHQASSEGNLIRFIDDQSVSDFYASRDLSIGRVNLEFGIRELFRQSTARFSNRYLSDTEINGLSSNEPLNEKQFSNEFGLIMKLILVGNDVLKAIFSNSWQVSMYINKGILREASGQSLIAISDDVIPRTNENQRTFGTQHPESISITTNGVVFGWDEKVGVYWADYGNGLIAISERKMSNYFTQKSIERLQPGVVTLNPAIYDVGNGQVLHTFSDKFTNLTRLPKATMCLNDHAGAINIVLTAYPSNATLIIAVGVVDPNFSTAELVKKLINAGSVGHGFTAAIDADGCVEVYAPKVDPLYSNGTLVLTFGIKDSYTFQFDEGLEIRAGRLTRETVAYTIGEKGTTQDRWPEFYSFTPEYYGRVGNDVVGFDNGQLWLHEKGVDFNMFYGVFYALRLEAIFKKDWQKNKVYKGKSYKSKSLDFYVPSATTPATADYPTGQFTKISKANFKAMQAGVYAKMNNDGNDTRFANQVDAIMNGRPMRGTFIKVVLENDSRESVELFSTKIIYFYSELS